MNQNITLSSHIFNLLPKLTYVAEKSIIAHQHGAVLLKNGTPVSWGYNSIRGNSTIHAEYDAIRQYLRSKGDQYFKCFEKQVKQVYKSKCIL